MLTRRDMILGAFSTLAATTLPNSSSAATLGDDLTTEDLATMEKLVGLKLTPAERKEILPAVKELQKNYVALRAHPLVNSVGPSFTFVPRGKEPSPKTKTQLGVGDLTKGEKPGSTHYATAVELSQMIRAKQISPVELTQLYLARIKKYSPQLLNVISICEERALAAAKQAEKEIMAGHYRGPLHGLPFGIKDLFSAKGYPTTWGAEPYEHQVIDEDSAVVQKLTEAGAILVAKTSVGALAMDDHWFRGKTKNPWNTKQGSSGSSAGSASGTAAGLWAFSIGTETLGSIVSPSFRCRVTGLRPTFGRVSRYGAMALSWTMDKAGPICRSAEDCAMVLSAIHGADPRDISSVTRPLDLKRDVKKLKIGYLQKDEALDDEDTGDLGEVLKVLRHQGLNPMPVTISQPNMALLLALEVEAAAAFQEITLDGRVNTITQSAWPGIFKTNHFASGPDYINAMRARSLLQDQFEKEFGEFDVILSNGHGSHLLFITNLTGHPQMLLPLTRNAKGQQRGVSLIGRLYDEGALVAVATAIQKVTKTHREVPPDFK